MVLVWDSQGYNEKTSILQGTTKNVTGRICGELAYPHFEFHKKTKKTSKPPPASSKTDYQKTKTLGGCLSGPTQQQACVAHAEVRL